MPEPLGDIEEGLRFEKSGMLDRALAHYEAATTGDDPLTVTTAWRRRASVLRTRCDWDGALAAARESAAVALRYGLEDAHAEALNAEAAVFQSQGDFDAAVPLLERILTMTKEPRIRGVALQNLGSIAAERGDYETAERRFLESYRCFRDAEYDWGQAFALNNYGRAAMDRGSLEIAERVLARAVELARSVEDLDLAALATMNLAETMLTANDLERADETASTALGYFEMAGNRWRRVECLRLLGDINRRDAQHEVATRCYQQALLLARELGVHLEITRLEERLRGEDNPNPVSET
ncbi:MAG TPA: tetratricopeptide repeat protein [Gemmatimonadaceae bacterium]|nr:tetratricopeptide repeat protein [Gemmatimonadaceae bacterium]